VPAVGQSPARRGRATHGFGRRPVDQVIDMTGLRQGQSLAAVGNNGHSNEPHLHLQVQDSPAAALATFLDEVTERALFAHVAVTNAGSATVLEWCGFVEVERETTDAEEIVHRLA
jgi:hypothetical protein